MKRKFIQVFAFIMAFILFISCPLSVYASEKWEGSLGLTLYYNKDKILQYFQDFGEFWLYGASQMGAIVKSDFVSFAENKKKMDDILSEGDKIGVYVDENDNAKGIFFSKEFMAQLKALLEEYAKTEQTKEENGGFYLMPTINYEDVPMEKFSNSYTYYTFRNIVREKGVLSVRLRYGESVWFVDPFSNPDHPELLVIDPMSINSYLNNPEVRVRCNTFCANDWKIERYPMMYFEDKNKIYHSCSEAVQYNTGSDGYTEVTTVNAIDNYNFCLYSTTGERVRVFVSNYAAKNYSAGNRKIYFSENYYNYVPEDLTVSIDDLQKSVDDLQKIIDELLKKISDQTSEKEIEELLRQILEELRKNPGGGGGGSGGGDVTVSVDLKETNSWLSKIYDKVGQIFDKMQEGFEDVVEQLKKIRNWSAVDTVIDGVDAVADWLDLIHDVLTDGAGSAVAALSSALQDSTDLMKQKFPFSIPWDILFFVSVLSAEPETPQFSIPFNFEFPALDLAVDYEMELDFTPLQWLSDLSRLILSMTYAAGLMKKTVDIVSANKEG